MAFLCLGFSGNSSNLRLRCLNPLHDEIKGLLGRLARGSIDKAKRG